MHLAQISSIVVAAVLVAGCDRRETPPPSPRPVIAQVVSAKADAGATVYSGEVRARYENDLAFRVGGKVIGRFVDVGSAVKKGQLLARLDAQDAGLAVESARSQLAAAEADHALARAELERYRDLYAKKFVAQAVLDARQTTFNTTKARLEQAQAQLATARNQSEYTALHAEGDGVITAINLEPGQVISPGQAVMRFARTEEKEIAINVSESRLAEVRAASAILISVWAAPDQRYHGRIREVAPTADPATRTFAVRISVPDADANMRLGMTATVALGDRAQDKAITLPLTALYETAGQPALWIVDPQTSRVTLRSVVIGAYREDGVIIRDGVTAGEVVVTAGVHKLVAGETVRVVEALGRTPSQERFDAAFRADN